MAKANAVFVGDEGFILALDTGTDVTTASTTQIIITKPDGTASTKTAGINSTKYLTYTIATGDLDQEGTYAFNAYVVIDGLKKHGDTAYLDVKGVGE